jgi:serine/threonine protein kinase/PAS domain-containing protein
MVVWRKPALPSNEESRQRAVCAYDILDTEPEEAYDRITLLCRRLFHAPIALLTFIDKDRVWFKSAVGLGDARQLDRGSGLCAWTLLSRRPEALVVPDMQSDLRFRDYPVVTSFPHARFYAGVPLLCPNTGHRLGTLCVVDQKPRPDFSAEQTALLAQLAAMAMREVDRRRRTNAARCAAVGAAAGDGLADVDGKPASNGVADGDGAAEAAAAALASSPSPSPSSALDRQGVMLLDASSPAGKWPVLLANDAWSKATGVAGEMAAGAHFWDLFEPPEPAQRTAVELAVEQGRSFELRVLCNGGLRDGTHQWTRLQMRPAASPGADAALSPAGARGYCPALAVSVPSSLASAGGALAAGGGGAEEDGAAAAAAAAATENGGGDNSSQQPRFYWALVEPADRELEAVVPETSPALLAEVEEAEEEGEEEDDVVPPPTANGHANGNGHGNGHHAPLLDPKAKAVVAQVICSGSSGSNSGASWAVGAAAAGRSSFDNPSSSSRGGSGRHHVHTLASGAADDDSLVVAGPPPPARRRASGSGGNGAGSGSGSGSGSGGRARAARQPAGGGPASTTFSFLAEDNPLHDITLGALLGWGSYGRVHRGWWNGSPVAIKVVQQPAAAAGWGAGGGGGANGSGGGLGPRAALEPLLHHRLSHPGIVKLYEVVTQRAEGNDDEEEDDDEDDDCATGGARNNANDLSCSGSGRFGPGGGLGPPLEVWMVLEHCDRGTLSDAVARGELADMRPGAGGCGFGAAAGGGGGLRYRYRPDALRVASTAREVAEAMAYLHAQCVLHGDLNCNNILLCSKPRGGVAAVAAVASADAAAAAAAADARPFCAKVADFGLSRLAREGDGQAPLRTATHGTATHMAPEVLRDNAHSRAADVWSFGVVLWELLSGERPFAGCSYAQVVVKVAALLDEHGNVSASGGKAAVLPAPEGAPAALARLMERCLAPRPEDRPTFDQIAAELSAFEKDAAVAAAADDA